MMRYSEVRGGGYEDGAEKKKRMPHWEVQMGQKHVVDPVVLNSCSQESLSVIYAAQIFSAEADGRLGTSPAFVNNFIKKMAILTRTAAVVDKRCNCGFNVPAVEPRRRNCDGDPVWPRRKLQVQRRRHPASPALPPKTAGMGNLAL
nr:probable inactive leucine-rich repeat receptor-like protein kinase At3g03770 [Ipomoea batatas]